MTNEHINLKKLQKEEFLISIKYISVVVKRGKENKKIRTRVKLEDAPEQWKQEGAPARKSTTTEPVISCFNRLDGINLRSSGHFGGLS